LGDRGSLGHAASLELAGRLSFGAEVGIELG
jgi:hypothetical protein